MKNKKSFTPELRLKKWDNEVNLSVGLVDNFPGATKHVLTNNVIEWKKPGITARFYPTGKEKAKKSTKPTHLRYVKAGNIDPINIASYYELNRHVDSNLPVITTIFPSKPCLVHYGFYPAEKFLIYLKSTYRKLDYHPIPFKETRCILIVVLP